MLQLILLSFVLLLAIFVYIFWQALGLFLITKIFKVAASTFKKSLTISIKLFLIGIPIGLLVVFLNYASSFLFAPKIGHLTGLALFFISANHFYEKYYHTKLSKNIVIFICSSLINIALVIVYTIMPLILFGLNKLI